MKSNPYPSRDNRRWRVLGRIGVFVTSCLLLVIVGVVTTTCNRQDEARAPDPAPAGDTELATTESSTSVQVPPRDSHSSPDAEEAPAADIVVADDLSALTAVEPFVAEDPPWDGPITFSAAEAFYTAGEYNDAVRAYTAYTDQHPENVWGHYMLGLSQRAAGAPAPAAAAFREALRLNPDHFKSHINLARVLLDEGLPVEAEHHASQAAELDPAAGVAHRILGRAYHEQGMNQDAIQEYKAALASNNRDVWAMNNLGLIRIEENRHGDALLPLARATQLRDDVAIFYNNLGAALERTGQLRAAEDAYRRTLALDNLAHKASISLARVAELPEDPDIQPVDLLVLAQRFVVEDLAAVPAAADTLVGGAEAFAGDLVEDAPAATQQ